MFIAQSPPVQISEIIEEQNFNTTHSNKIDTFTLLAHLKAAKESSRNLTPQRAPAAKNNKGGAEANVLLNGASVANGFNGIEKHFVVETNHDTIVDEEEKKEEQSFELLEVVDEEEDAINAASVQHNAFEANSSKVNGQQEQADSDEDGEFELVVIKVPKRANKAKRVPDLLPIHQQHIGDRHNLNLSTTKTYENLNRKKAKKSPPPLLSVVQVENVSHTNSRFWSSRQEVNYSLRCQDQNYLPDPPQLLYQNGSFSNEHEEETSDDEDEDELRGPIEGANENNDSMGLTELFRKFLQFAHINGDLLKNNTNEQFNNQQEQHRKRKLFNNRNSSSIKKIKYRKVENHFPKVITHLLDEDAPQIMRVSSPPYNRLSPLNRMSCSNGNAANQRRLTPVLGRSTARKSMFEEPVSIKRVVKPSYADIDLSDDDEPVLLENDFGYRNAQTRENCAFGGAIPKPKPQVRNIPILTEEQTHLRSALPPPPPLMLGESSRIANAQRYEKAQPANYPTYAEALRKGPRPMPGLQPDVSRSPTVSLYATSSESATAPTIDLTRRPSRNKPDVWGLNDRTKYQQLLHKFVPDLYGCKDTITWKKTNMDADKERKRSALFLAAHDASQGKVSMLGRIPLSQLSMSSMNHSINQRQPLSSTAIRLDDDTTDEEVKIYDVNGLSSAKPTWKKVEKPASEIIALDSSEESQDSIITLDGDTNKIMYACSKALNHQDSRRFPLTAGNIKEREKLIFTHHVEPVNSLRDTISTNILMKDNTWLDKLMSNRQQKLSQFNDDLQTAKKILHKAEQERRAAEGGIKERMHDLRISDLDTIYVGELDEEIPDEEPEFFELTQEHRKRIKAAITGRSDEVLISKFNLNITRRDIYTLMDLNWLNDEIINFYMNLLTERSELKHESHGMPRVYAMNTFFVPILMKKGHAGVKRWTRKVDLFAKDVIPVPVHVGGVHWCMAIIHLKNRTIKYYDSMHSPNPAVLNALEQYLKEESLDKRKMPFDTSDFKIESVQNVPHQTNGSDCGVFSCMFAEYATRNKPFNFSQDDMPYFRQKMVLEIVQGQLCL